MDKVGARNIDALKRQNIFGVIKVSISSILRYQHGILLQLLPLKLVLFFFIHFLYQFFAFFYSTLYTYRSSNYWYRGDGDNLYFSFPLSLKKWQQLLCQLIKSNYPKESMKKSIKIIQKEANRLRGITFTIRKLEEQ